MSDNFKMMLLKIFIVTLLILCPITATFVVSYRCTEIYEDKVAQYDSYSVHEMYREKWNYCPNCGEYLGGTE